MFFEKLLHFDGLERDGERGERKEKRELEVRVQSIELYGTDIRDTNRSHLFSSACLRVTV